MSKPVGSGLGAAPHSHYAKEDTDAVSFSKHLNERVDAVRKLGDSISRTLDTLPGFPKSTNSTRKKGE